MLDWFDRHAPTLERAVQASVERSYWSPFIESPGRRHHPEGAHERGRAAFGARLGSPFLLNLPGVTGSVVDEVSPYTGEPLGVAYGTVDPDALYAAAHAAWPAWRDAHVKTRVGVCLEILNRWRHAAFENAYATMHTTGQSFLMAFAGSGANSLDRGLEGLTYAWRAMTDIPAAARFERAFGRGAPVVLDKRYRLVPRGVAVVVACATYPAWNAYPAILANLATGNPVVVKPHPRCVLPMAIAVEAGRGALAEAGFAPNLLTLAADSVDAPIAQHLLGRRDTAIIDFTGSQRFGAWIESSCGHAQVYTETAGCNSVVLESAPDLDAALEAVAHGICSFSSQMCTAPQNIFVPRAGALDGSTRVTPDEVASRLAAHIDRLTEEPANTAALCGAIQSPRTLDELDDLTSDIEAAGTVVRRATPYAHPEFPEARTATPLLGLVDVRAHALYAQEHFGPAAFVIAAADRESALAHATHDARERGAIASYLYSADEGFAERAADAYALAGASLGVNLLRQRPINYAAAFSDFHVSGLNPAGNACLTDLDFTTGRFRVVQTKTERPQES
jgi:phenylacetic acid degradation protein paaN